MTRRRNRYGIWGKHLEVFDLAEEFIRDPRVAERLQEGTGAPEGRADFPIFLQTVIRHVTRERFRVVASRWDQYMAIESAQDFREHTTSELGAIRGIGPVNEEGEYDRMRSVEAPGPSFAVAKYGGIYSITYELIINDDTNQILNRIPAEIGRSTAEYLAQVFVAFIESNPTYSVDGDPFFSVGRGNEVTGSGADLTEDNVMSILETMMLRRTADNLPMAVNPTAILVRGPKQAATIARMRRSTETAATEDVSSQPGTYMARGRANVVNEYIPEPIQEPWLNDPNDYIILGDTDPGRAAFRAAFLRGQREPFIGMKNPEMRNAIGGGDDLYRMEIDDIPYKVRHVFGAAAGEPLAAFRGRP